MKKSILLFLMLCLMIESNAQPKHIITSDSVNLYVTVKGKGIPCLYLHGGPGSGSYWLEKFVGDSLEQHFQMIYLDQRGVCRSSSPKDKNYSMDRMVKDFEEVREALGIKQWITFGHSFGGVLQMGYALRYPKVIKGMIMFNCTLNQNETYETGWCPNACEILNIDKKPFLDKNTPIMARWDTLIRKLNRENLMWKLGFSSFENMKIMGETFREIPNWNWDMEPIIMEIKDYWADFTRETMMLKMPVLFFYGTKDLMIGIEHYKNIKFPNMILWSSDVTHMPFMENNDDIMKAISSFQKKYKF